MSVHYLAQSTTYLTPGRAWSLVAVFFGLVGLVIGILALRRTRRRGSVVALAAGFVGTVIGGLVVAAADGGPGTGYGIVGGFVALVIGVAAMVLGWLAMVRARRTV